MRRAPSDSRLTPSGFFAWRTPLLPFDALEDFSHGLCAPGTDPEDSASLARALEADRALLRSRLREWASRPEVREALFLASPSLEDSLQHAFSLWARGLHDERSSRVEHSLVRYLARMAGRSTPFGLFSGCSIGQLGSHSRLVLSTPGTWRRHTRLDTEYLQRLREVLEKLPSLRAHLRYRPSPELYRAVGHLRLLESSLQGQQRFYRLSSIEPSPELEHLLAHAASGASLASLADSLLQRVPDLDPAEVRSFIDSLVDERLLVSHLALPVTGDEPAYALLRALEPLPPASSTASALSSALQGLSELDAQGLGASPSRYRELVDSLQSLPLPPELTGLFNVDLIKPAAEASLGPKVLDELRRGVRLLHRLHRPGAKWSLKRFCRAFSERYGDQELPLLEVLDEESGIGFDSWLSPGETEDSPLLEGLRMRSQEPSSSWGRREEWLLHRLDALQRSGGQELLLDEEDLSALEGPPPPPLPDALCVFAALMAPSAEEVGRGHFQLRFDYAHGPSGARLLGRFCHADPELAAHVREHLRAEERLRPHALFAEVVHLPASRAANIVLRPLLREHEIACLGDSGAPPESQIALSDLLVSVSGDTVRLRSARLQREVLPRLTNAHYTQHAGTPPVYRFLYALSEQGVATPLVWSWGSLSRAPFLPRVRSGRLVLSRACWNLHGHELKALAGFSYADFQRWRSQRGLPRWVAFSESDQELPLDLDNPLMLEVLAHLASTRQSVRLTELLPGPEALCARGPQGRFRHELVVPFLRAEASGARGEQPRPSPSSPRTVRRFAPGGPWLFARLYCGSVTAERVLQQLVVPVVREALGSGAAERWFFIRYADPHRHLRLRLRGDPQRLLAEVLPSLHRVAAPLLEDGTLHRLALDTYEPELERYGGEVGLELAEQLFQADSEAALELVEILPADTPARWRGALLAAHRLLEDLGLSPSERLVLAERARASFTREFQPEAPLARQVGQRFREQRAALEPLLALDASLEEPLASALPVLHRRSERLRPLAAALRQAQERGLLSRSVQEMAADYLHMQMNRLLRSAPREHERVLYDWLHRLYRSQATHRV